MNYELIYILTPKLSEDDAKKKATEISQFISKEGEKVALEDFWGKRELTYPLKKFTDGYYVVLQFTAEPEMIAKLEKNLQLREDIVRFLVVKKTKLAKDKDEIKAPTAPGAEETAGLTRAAPESDQAAGEKSIKPSKKTTKAKAKISELDKKLDDILEKGMDD